MTPTATAPNCAPFQSKPANNWHRLQSPSVKYARVAAYKVPSVGVAAPCYPAPALISDRDTTFSYRYRVAERGVARRRAHISDEMLVNDI